MTDTGMQLRIAQRDLAKLEREHTKTLRQWTNERGELRARIRDLQRRERMWATLLSDYLAGYTPEHITQQNGSRR